MKTPKNILFTMLIILAMLSSACSPAPQSVVNSWRDALNKGDMEAALSYLDENAVVTVIPAMEGNGIYNGHDEIRGWYEPLISSKGVTTLSGCKVEDETVTCLDTYTDESLKSMGVDFIEGDFTAVVSNGKIQSYTVAIKPESLAKFPPAPASEARLTTMEDMAGKWDAKYGDYVIMHEFKANNTVIVSVTGMGVISNGPIWFEDDLLKFNDPGGDCAGMIGKYEVYGTYEGDQLIQLRFVLVGEDSCSDRRETLNGNTLIPSKP